MKNMYPSYLIDKQVKRFLHNKFATNNSNAVKQTKTTLYYVLFQKLTKTFVLGFTVK